MLRGDTRFWPRLVPIVALGTVLCLEGFREPFHHDRLGVTAATYGCFGRQWLESVRQGGVPLRLVRMPSASRPGELATYGHHPPALALLVGASFGLFGIGEAQARVIPVVFAMCELLLMGILTRRFAGQRAALWTTFLMATSPMGILLGHYVDTLGSVGLASSLGVLWMVVRLRDRPGWGRFAGVVTVTLGACTLSWMPLYLLPPLWIWSCLDSPRRRRKELVWGLPLLGLVALGTQVAYAAWSTGGGGDLLEVWRRYSMGVGGPRAWISSTGGILWRFHGAPWLLLSLAGSSLFLWRGRRWRHAASFALTLLLYAAPAYLLGGVKVAREFVWHGALLPFVAFGGGLALAAGKAAARRPWAGPAAWGLALVILVPLGRSLARERITESRMQPAPGEAVLDVISDIGATRTGVFLWEHAGPVARFHSPVPLYGPFRTLSSFLLVCEDTIHTGHGLPRFFLVPESAVPEESRLLRVLDRDFPLVRRGEYRVYAMGGLAQRLSAYLARRDAIGVPLDVSIVPGAGGDVSRIQWAVDPGVDAVSAGVAIAFGRPDWLFPLAMLPKGITMMDLPRDASRGLPASLFASVVSRDGWEGPLVEVAGAARGPAVGCGGLLGGTLVGGYALAVVVFVALRRRPRRGMVVDSTAVRKVGRVGSDPDGV